MTDSTNFESRPGESFKPDSLAVIFREGQLVMDFRKTAPRLDQSSSDKIQTVVSEHNPVVMRPEKAKMFKELLEKNIENYEEKFGKIELPEQENPDSSGDSETSEVEDSQNYIG